MKLILLFCVWIAIPIAYADQESTGGEQDNQDSIASDARGESAPIPSQTYMGNLIDESIALLSILRSEIGQIHGDTVVGVWSSVENRMQVDRVARIIWLLIFALTISGGVFAISFVYGIIIRAPQVKQPHVAKVKIHRSRARVRPNRLRDEKKSSALKTQVKTEELDKIIKSGKYDNIEEVFRSKLKHRPDEIGTYLYLFACNALNNEPAKFVSLVSEIFPKGLNASDELHLHIADIGRVVSPKDFPLSSYPSPKEPFEVRTDLIGDSLGSVAEFGNVQTLLDLVRVYMEMEQFDQTRHLIVEVLARGDTNQRWHAMEFSRTLKKLSNPK